MTWSFQLLRRRQIKERTLRGKREKARRGLVVTPENAPYGYRPDPARAVASAPGRPASEYGGLCQGLGATRGATAAGGR